MGPVNQAMVDEIIDIIGQEQHVGIDAIRRMGEIVNNPEDITRFLNIIPEAFGIVLISHTQDSDGIVMPDTFFVHGSANDWVELPMDAEPIFRAATIRAQHIYHNGPRSTFQNISERSALLSAFSDALAAEANLEGAQLSGPAFAELSASIYRS